MKTMELIESRLARMRTVMATSKAARALNTERSYVGHIRSFLWFCAYCPQVKTAAPEELARLYVVPFAAAQQGSTAPAAWRMSA